MSINLSMPERFFFEMTVWKNVTSFSAISLMLDLKWMWRNYYHLQRAKIVSLYLYKFSSFSRLCVLLVLVVVSVVGV